MNKRHIFSLNIGLSSIVLIFTVLCLISFGVLSLVSANADFRLSQKVLKRSSAYYDACNLAEDDIRQFDAQLRKAYSQGAANQSELIANLCGQKGLDSYSQSFTYYISDIQYLSVKLSVNYPSPDDVCLYKIDEWKIVTDNIPEYDDNLHIYK